MTIAKIGHGSKFELNNGTALVALVEILGVPMPDQQAETVECTSMESAGRIREYIGGLIESGEGEIAMNFAAGSPTDIAIRGSFGLTRAYKITIPTNAAGVTSGTWTVSGNCIVTGYGREIPIDDKMVATLRVKFTGLPTEAAGV